MTTLHDQLRDLADEAPGSLPAPGLWDRGRRYHRLRRTGTLAVLGGAVLVLALLGGVTWQRSAPPVQPATGSVGLPDRVWDPSPWLPGTGSPGRLVALAPADRGSWTGMHPGVVGVSAVTGEYAFLDLPDANSGHMDEAVLAPDGNHVAYWLSGDTEGTPNTSSSAEPVAGVSVLDTMTGEVHKHWIRTEHGIEPDCLAWADADTLVYSAGQIVGGDDASEMDQSSSMTGTITSWTPGSAPRPVPGDASGFGLEGAAHGRILVDTDSSRPGRAHRLIDLARPSDTRFVAVPSMGGHLSQLIPIALDPTGRRIALVPGNRNPAPVHAGVVGDLHQVPNTQGTWGVLDWLDAHTLVTLRRERDRLQEGSGLYRVSVTTGESRELMRFPANSYGGGWRFATDLLRAPSVHADPPPRPLDPRVMTGLGIATVLAAAGGVVLWRRRVQP